jgi:hypothetical protein
MIYEFVKRHAAARMTASDMRGARQAIEGGLAGQFSPHRAARIIP